MGLGEVTFTREHIETLRALMVVGWALLFLAWMAQLGYEARQDRAKGKATTPYELCKLHQRPTHECRDQHKDES